MAVEGRGQNIYFTRARSLSGRRRAYHFSNMNGRAFVRWITSGCVLQGKRSKDARKGNLPDSFAITLLSG